MPDDCLFSVRWLLAAPAGPWAKYSDFSYVSLNLGAARKIGIDDKKKSNRTSIRLLECLCGDKEIRTLDPLLAKQVLYQLSYEPIYK